MIKNSIKNNALAILSILCAVFMIFSVIEYMVITRQKSDIEKLQIQAKSDVTVIKACATKISRLNAEIKRNNQACAENLAGYAETTAELQRMSEPRSTYGGIGNEVQTGNNTGSGNPILDNLNGMFPDLREASGTGMHQSATDPASSAGPDILPGKLAYCLDEVGAKDLLKNIIIMRNWGNGSAHILKLLQIQNEVGDQVQKRRSSFGGRR